MKSAWARDAIEFIRRQEAHAQVYLEHYLRNVLILSETLRGFMRSPPLDHIVFGITAVAHRLYQSIH